jgi:3-hydroxybutyryl-CoA dehydrogenase
MKIVVCTNDELKEEFLAQGVKEGLVIDWVTSVNEFSQHTDADAYFDLLFDYTPARIQQIKALSNKPVFINAAIIPNDLLPDHIIRINAWRTFLKRTIVEASGVNEDWKDAVVEIFAQLNRTVEWMINEDGFVSTRVISQIINEAYFALAEKVSTKDQIDLAMKLGTNYPYGPFEWSKLIGLRNIYDLLHSLSKKQERYEPAELLKKEALME